MNKSTVHYILQRTMNPKEMSIVYNIVIYSLTMSGLDVSKTKSVWISIVILSKGKERSRLVHLQYIAVRQKRYPKKNFGEKGKSAQNLWSSSLVFCSKNLFKEKWVICPFIKTPCPHTHGHTDR